jgi:hypothetical protein
MQSAAIVARRVLLCQIVLTQHCNPARPEIGGKTYIFFRKLGRSVPPGYYSGFTTPRDFPQTTPFFLGVRGPRCMA